MMAEAIVISAFLILLIYLQMKEQKKIVVKAKSNPIKMSLTILLAMLLLVIFWQPELSNQIKLIAFAIMITTFGFLSEGLGEDSLVKFGILSGDYQQYQWIQLEPTNNKDETFVSFYKRRNTRISLLISQNLEELLLFFDERGFSEKVILGEFEGVNVEGENKS